MQLRPRPSHANEAQRRSPVAGDEQHNIRYIPSELLGNTSFINLSFAGNPIHSLPELVGRLKWIQAVDSGDGGINLADTSLTALLKWIFETGLCERSKLDLGGTPLYASSPIASCSSRAPVKSSYTPQRMKRIYWGSHWKCSITTIRREKGSKGQRSGARKDWKHTVQCTYHSVVEPQQRQSRRSSMSAAEFSPSTSPSTLTRSQRWARFVDEELVSFAMASTAYAGVVLAKEYRSAGPHAPRRLHLALQNTRALLPAIALSAAVGIAGMKLSIAAVSHAREDYTRSSVLLAFPVAGALLQMQRGPRAMAMSAISFGVIGFSADHLFAQWHRRNAEAQGEVAIQHDHHHEAFHLESFRSTTSFMLESPQK